MLDGASHEELTEIVRAGFPSVLAPVVEAFGPDRVVLTAQIGDTHLAGNGYLHAGAVVTLADTACGYGTLAGLPDGAAGFTTVELKSNHFASTQEGLVAAEATRVHAGRSTQVWDATVSQGDRILALFRCTQLVLYPRD
jgi:1,4-dihydroxy-2-naphthoyl-CoA hydrolase